MGSSSNADWAQQQSPQIIYKIGIYGWRKRCLYVFLLLLMVTVIVNIALTVWILKVMDFNLHGMGKLRIQNGKIRIEGTAEFLKAIHTQQLKSLAGAGLSIESAKNITMNARDGAGNIVNRIHLGGNKLEAFIKKFQINTRRGESIFYADEREVQLGARRLRVTDSGGVTFSGSVQTPKVSSESDHLRIESPTRGLYIAAPEGISVQSEGGSIDVISRQDLTLESINKAIILDGRTIKLQNIPLISSTDSESQQNLDVYQLCVCKNGGKLFLSAPSGNCNAPPELCS